tara:strand:- start:11376 stop:13754 length:2379 start_codon:yes stop_codon:yes gene_type:complete
MKEVRIGLVLYGGVSLAVYMNGIVTELWNLLRASQARTSDPAAKLDGTADLYLKLLNELSRTDDHDELRVVVDAVAGTSAGGVNGVVLAKAVVEGADASVLNQVWLDDADISKLKADPPRKIPWYIRAPINGAAMLFGALQRARTKLNELPGLSWEWVLDHGYSVAKDGSAARSPLNGDYFAEMIARTFETMAASPHQTPPLLPTRGTFDLFVTRTDLHGWPRHLPVDVRFHPKPLYERTHAHVMHFRRGMAGEGFEDDFGLTYAARTTAGFPIAFAPVNHDAIATQYKKIELSTKISPIAAFTSRHLREHELMKFPTDHAWMVDGGVLDNKPFTRVAEAIENKPADHEVFRSVIYIEPDPETEVDPSPKTRPGPLAVASGMFPLFRHEPIHEDLRRLHERNMRVERIREMVRANAADSRRIAEDAGREAGLAWPPAANELEAWRTLTHRLAAEGGTAGYAGYTALKARRAAETLAQYVCRALNYPAESRHGYLVRRVVRAWLSNRNALAVPAYDRDENAYIVDDLQRSLLDGFDTAFRLRRLRALVAAANEMYAGADSPLDGEARTLLDHFKRDASDIIRGFEQLLEPSPDAAKKITDAFRNVLEGRGIDDAIAGLSEGEAAIAERYNNEIEDLFWSLQPAFARASRDLNDRLMNAVDSLHGPHRGHLAETFVAFSMSDIAIYPIMDSAQLTELIPVSVMRISPGDCVSLSTDPKRLKSRELGAFAGFLERSARAHDLMWGRLDGAERLVDLLLRASLPKGRTETAAAQARRNQFLKLVQARILKEEKDRT